MNSEQNLSLAIVAALAAALVGAVIWAVITVTTQYQIGFMAIGVGLLVGFAVRKFGRGQEPVFGMVGAVFALLGCILGNLLSATSFLATAESVPFSTEADSVLGHPGFALLLMEKTFDGMDLLFYGIAVYEGYKFAIRPAAAPTAATG